MGQTSLFGPEQGQEITHDIEEATREAFEELENQGVLTAADRAKRAALLKGAQALDRGLAAVKVSVSTSTIFTQFLDKLDTLPKPAAGTDPELDAFDAALAALTSEALGVDSPA